MTEFGIFRDKECIGRWFNRKWEAYRELWWMRIVDGIDTADLCIQQFCDKHHDYIKSDCPDCKTGVPRWRKEIS